MIAWWWMIPAILIGASVGAVLMGLCCANSKPKRWWEDEE